MQLRKTIQRDAAGVSRGCSYHAFASSLTRSRSRACVGGGGARAAVARSLCQHTSLTTRGGKVVGILKHFKALAWVV